MNWDAPRARASGCKKEEARQAISDFDHRLTSMNPEAVVLKCTLPIAATEEFLGLVRREAQNEKVRTPFVVYPGVGIIHVGLLDLHSATRAAGLISRIRAAAEQAGGAVVVVNAAVRVQSHAQDEGNMGPKGNPCARAVYRFNLKLEQGFA